MISAIIPTLNEQAIVAEAVQSLLDDPAGCEVVVVDGGSDDATLEIAGSFGPPVRLIEQRRDGPRGRGAACNQAAALAQGDVLVFLHADTRLPAGGLGLIEAALADPSVIGGGFLPTFAGTGTGLARIGLAAIERGWRARTRAFRWFAGDQAPFVRREALFAGGGYPTAPLAEDWAFAARLRSLGRLAVIERPVTISARRHVANGVVRTLLVTGSVEMMYHARVDPSFLAWWYRRWLPRER